MPTFGSPFSGLATYQYLIIGGGMTAAAAVDGIREVDGVVTGVGIEPNSALAHTAGIEVEDGIVVDKLLCTSHRDIYAAGDVAAFHTPALGKRIRVEHEDAANSMGRLAGRNMAGKSEPYDELPFLYSYLFDLGCEAVGKADARLETFADLTQPNVEGLSSELPRARGAAVECVGSGRGGPPIDRRPRSVHGQGS